MLYMFWPPWEFSDGDDEQNKFLAWRVYDTANSGSFILSSITVRFWFSRAGDRALADSAASWD